MVRKIIIETLVARIVEVNENNETTNTEEWKMESLDIELNIEGRTDYMENVKENVVKHFKEVRKEWKEEVNRQVTTGNEESNTGEIEQIKYSKGYEKLKEDLSRTELERNLENESEEIMEIDSNMTIEEMYKEVTNNSKKRKREDVGEWYDVGKKFKRNVEEIIEDEGITEQKARNKVYKKLIEKEDVESEETCVKKRKTSIRNKVQRAEKIFKLFKGLGGKRRIKEISCSVDEIGRCKKTEIDKLIEEFGRTEPGNERINEPERQREESSQILGNEEIDRGLSLMGYNNEQINEELRSRYRRMIFSGVRQEEIGRILGVVEVIDTPSPNVVLNV